MTDRSLVQIAFYAALIAALGLLPKVDLPFGVPITAQTLGVMLAGVMLGPVRGALAMLLFLFLIALGAPLLAGGRGGLGVFASPTVGFLIGFPIGAFVAGLIMQRTKALSVIPAAALAALIGGVGVVYLFGVPGMAYMAKMSLVDASKICAAFIPGDLIKVAITAVVAETIARGLPRALLSRT
ncbi:biotin transporter BioY [uncultured Roseibium sp.]|uniref:biotin transporter BioY n=1 Tax=uncultured Roseibium sp. TaxID=1936171 RepID=UPI003217BCD4